MYDTDGLDILPIDLPDFDPYEEDKILFLQLAGSILVFSLAVIGLAMLAADQLHR